MGKRILLEDLTCIMKMQRDGKTQADIAKALNLHENTVENYIMAVQSELDGVETWACRKVSMDLVREYLRIGGNKKDEKQEGKRVSEVRKDVKVNGMTEEMARKIATELDWKTPVSALARLTGVNVEDVNRIQAYLKLLSDKESDKAIAYKTEGFFALEVYQALEKWAGFTPKVKTKEELEQDYQKKLLEAIDTLSAYQDTIHDELKNMHATQITKETLIEIMRPLQAEIIKMAREIGGVSAAINEYTKASRDLNQSVRLLVNANLNNKR